MPNNRALVGSKSDVNLPILRLDGCWISEISFAFGDIPSMRKGVPLVRGDGCGQRRPIVKTVIIDEKQMPVAHAEQLDRGVWIGKLCFHTVTPGFTAVVRFGANHISIIPRFVISAASAKREQVRFRKLHNGGL